MREVHSKSMAVTKEVLARQLAAEDPKLCRDKAVELLREGRATESAEWFGKCIRATPADASLYWARSHAWEKAGKRRQAVIDAGVGVCLRPRVAAGFMRLSAAFEAQGRHADVVRACFLGMRCGDTSKNGLLSQRMTRAREAGKLPPLDWKPADRRERWAWTLLSFRAFLLRAAARIAGRLYLGGAGLALKACKGGDGFVRPPWPPGAMPPVIFSPSA